MILNRSAFIKFRNSEGETQFINLDSIECIYIKSNGEEDSFRIGINSKTGRDYIIEPYIDFKGASKFEDVIIKSLNNAAILQIQKGE